MENEHQNNASGLEAVNETDCLTESKTIEIISDKEGTVFYIDNINLGIRVAADSMPLLPCNLPLSFQESDLKIKFSGAIKEIKPNELWAGQPFVLTAISKR